MAQRFMRVEAYSHVKGRSNKRHSMAVTVGMSGRPTTIHDEFDVLSLDRPQVDALISGMNRALKNTGKRGATSSSPPWPNSALAISTGLRPTILTT